MTAQHRRDQLTMQLLAARAVAGNVPLEITADGVRLRDDIPIGFELTPIADLLLVDVDAPIPMVLAS